MIFIPIELFSLILKDKLKKNAQNQAKLRLELEKKHRLLYIKNTRQAARRKALLNRTMRKGIQRENQKRIPRMAHYLTHVMRHWNRYHQKYPTKPIPHDSVLGFNLLNLKNRIKLRDLEFPEWMKLLWYFGDKLPPDLFDSNSIYFIGLLRVGVTMNVVISEPAYPQEFEIYL